MAGMFAAELSFGSITMYLFGGLALFLFGMEQMTDALKMVAGDGMKNVLARLTTNRFTAAFAGAFVTSVIQSSSVTTVLVVGFISAGLMTLTQSVGVIMGANIGTTITAQIVAFKVTQYALVLVALGFSLLFFSKKERLRHYGHMIMGLGLIFFGMEMMSNATRPLRDFEPFINLMKSMENPFIGILIGAAFTAIIQSSSATTGVVIVLAKDGAISLEAGIALSLGANIGTCVTAMLAAIGKPRAAIQAAVVHVLFNVAGVAIWFGLIDQLAWAVGQLSGNTARQIANAHTVFNVANTVLLIGFAGPIALLAETLVPERLESETDARRPKYLDDLLLQTPAMALDIARMELGRLGACAVDMVRHALKPVISGSKQDLDALERMDDDVDRLHAAVITYLGRLSQENLSKRQSEQLHDYMAAANYMESIGDMVETNLVGAGNNRRTHEIQFSNATQDMLKQLHDKVVWTVEQAVRALVNADPDMAGEVMAAKSELNRLASMAEEHLSKRLIADAPHRLSAFRIESELIEYLKRVYYFAKRIAKVVIIVDVEGAKDGNEDAAKEAGNTVLNSSDAQCASAERVTTGAASQKE